VHCNYTIFGLELFSLHVCWYSPPFFANRWSVNSKVDVVNTADLYRSQDFFFTFKFRTVNNAGFWLAKNSSPRCQGKYDQRVTAKVFTYHVPQCSTSCSYERWCRKHGFLDDSVKMGRLVFFPVLFHIPLYPWDPLSYSYDISVCLQFLVSFCHV